MKILLVTETWDLTNGPYETPYPFYCRVLERLGHQVQAVDNKKHLVTLSRLKGWNHVPGRVRAGLYKGGDIMVNRRLRHTAQTWQPDLILLNKCENITLGTIFWLKQHTDAVIFNWDHDNPFWPSNTSMDLLRSIPLYDGFGILAEYLIPVLYSLGCQRVEYLPMFFNPERFNLDGEPSAADRARFSSEIAFIGNGSLERAEMLRHLVDFDLAIWGIWDFLPEEDPLRAHLRGRYLDGCDYGRALRCAKIAVNVLNIQCRMANNTRTFEVTGMGTMLLTEYTREQAEDLFIEDQEIVCYRSPEELQEKARYYLTHEDERRRIAKAGRARTLSEHTLERRLKRIVEVAEEIHEQRDHE